MRTSKFALTLTMAAMLASCGGGGGGAIAGGGSSGGTPTPSPAPTPTPTGQCSLSERQDWVLARMQEWYLFPSLLNENVSKSAHSTLQSYIDALVAPARAESKDRFFTYITSIEEENAFFQQGASAGFGVRLTYDVNARTVTILEAFEGAPALGQNMDRGSEILAIGTTANNLQLVTSIMAAQGPQGIINALGPDTVGTVRVLRIRDQAGIVREISLSKTEYSLDPVSDIYGAKIINDGGKLVGYLNLRTFIDTAGPDLIAAFESFKAQGVTELIIDQRYNGGGLISIAELMGDLMGDTRQGQVFDYITFRDSKSSENSTYTFNPGAQSLLPTKIAFIGTDGTASASEMVINGMQPYLAASNMALIGSNTYGKPVGQIALDQSSCDDRLRVIALKIENADHQGEYFTGLASTVPNLCLAADDLSAPMGDPSETMTARALDFLAGRSCATASASRIAQPSGREFLMPENPSTAKRNVPGLF